MGRKRREALTDLPFAIKLWSEGRLTICDSENNCLRGSRDRCRDYSAAAEACFPRPRLLMLTIRKEQMAVFRGPAVKAFEERMVAHLGRCFPKQCRALSEPELRETIQYGIKAAAKYGIIIERDVCRYIDLMVVLGRDFDRDPKLPWASSILNNRALKDPGYKLERLSKAFKRQVHGG